MNNIQLYNVQLKEKELTYLWDMLFTHTQISAEASGIEKAVLKAEAEAFGVRFKLRPVNGTTKIDSCLTVKQLKDLLVGHAEVDSYGEPTEVWLRVGTGTGECREIYAKNNSTDLLLGDTVRGDND